MDQPDRLYISKNKYEKLKTFNVPDYFGPVILKDIFMLAMVLGSNLYTKGYKFDSAKFGLFNDRDIEVLDRSIIYALTKPYLDDTQDINDNNKVYEIAQGMADKGLSILFSELEEAPIDDGYLYQTIDTLDGLYKDAKENNLFLN